MKTNGKQGKSEENEGNPMRKQWKERKMKENQWNMKGKPIQTEKQKKFPKKKQKNPKKNPNPYNIV